MELFNTLLILIVIATLFKRVEDRRNVEQCAACMYDLRGLPPGSVCPECGGSERRTEVVSTKYLFNWRRACLMLLGALLPYLSVMLGVSVACQWVLPEPQSAAVRIVLADSRGTLLNATVPAVVMLLVVARLVTMRVAIAALCVVLIGGVIIGTHIVQGHEYRLRVCIPRVLGYIFMDASPPLTILALTVTGVSMLASTPWRRLWRAVPSQS